MAFRGRQRRDRAPALLGVKGLQRPGQAVPAEATFLVRWPGGDSVAAAAELGEEELWWLDALMSTPACAPWSQLPS